MSRFFKVVAVLTVLGLVGVPGVSSAQTSKTFFQSKGWQNGPWERYDHRKGMTLWVNEKVSGDADAVRVDLVIPVPPSKLYPLITDPKRARKYSFIREFKPLWYNERIGYLYQRVQSTGIDDRDFTVFLTLVTPEKKDQGPYGWVWRQANDKGPKSREKEGIVRAVTVSGSYMLFPVADGKKTLVSYRLHFDPSSWVPNFLINRALRNGAYETVSRLRRDSRKLHKW